MELTQVASSPVNGKDTWGGYLNTSQKLRFNQLPNQHGTTWAVTSELIASESEEGTIFYLFAAKTVPFFQKGTIFNLCLENGAIFVAGILP